MCVAPVNSNDAGDPRNHFFDVAKYTGTPLQSGVMQVTISDPAKQQTYGYIRGVKNAGQLRSLSTVNIRVERSATDPSEPWIVCKLAGTNQEDNQILTGRCTLVLPRRNP